MLKSPTLLCFQLLLFSAANLLVQLGLWMVDENNLFIFGFVALQALSEQCCGIILFLNITVYAEIQTFLALHTLNSFC